MENGKAVLATRETGADLLADGIIQKIVYVGGLYGELCVLVYPYANGGVGFVEIDPISDHDANQWVSAVKKQRPDAELQVTTWC